MSPTPISPRAPFHFSTSLSDLDGLISQSLHQDTFADSALTRRQFNPFTESQEIEPWLWSILLALAVESALYGMHIILFFLAIRFLLPKNLFSQWSLSSICHKHRGRRRASMSRNRLILLLTSILMFALATADISISWHIAFSRTEIVYKGSTRPFVAALWPKFILYLVNAFIADVLVIIRCYVVWGNSKLVLYVAGGFLAVGTIFGIIGEAATTMQLKRFLAIYLVSMLVLNLGLTLITAGRILWISREVKRLVGPAMAKHYHNTVGILIESGLLYTLSIIFVVACSRTILIIMAACISVRVVCIMPILIIVQIALGKSTLNVEQTVHRVREGTRSVVVLDTIVSSGGAQESLSLSRQDGHSAAADSQSHVEIETKNEQRGETANGGHGSR